MAERAKRETSQARSSARQQLLVDAAASLLIEQGALAVTHRAVAGRAGVPAGSANYYFPSKDVLFAEAVRRAEQIRSTSAAELAAAITARDRGATATARLLIETFYAPALTPHVVTVRLEPMLAAHRDDTLRTIMAEFRPLHLEALRTVLRRSGRAVIADGDDIELIAQMIDASLMYAGQVGHDDPVSFAARSVARLIDLADPAAAAQHAGG